MQIFLENCTHLLTRNQEKKFEDVFLVKIESIVCSQTSCAVLSHGFTDGSCVLESAFFV